MPKKRPDDLLSQLVKLRVPDGSAVDLKPDRAAMSSAYEGERVLDGFASVGRVEAELSRAQDAPMDRPRQFEKARSIWQAQWFVREIIKLRYYFFHFGFRIGCEDGKVTPAIKNWERNHRKFYRRYAREAWLEWLPLDNLVGIWRSKGGKLPITFPPENCEYKDLFGHEVLEITHNVTQEHITTIGAFSRAEKKAFTATPNKLKLTHEDDSVFGFHVLKRERTGAGFGVPTLGSIFVPAAQMTSMDVSDAQLAAACRTVYEQHKFGHEIKSGIHAGSNAHFWKKPRAEAFEKQIKGKTGLVRITTNFDHSIEYPRPDPKHFEQKRYEAPMNKLALWSMPLGQILLGKSLNPMLMTLLKHQAIGERDYMAEHLYEVFTEALDAPKNIKLCWSNRCFSDPRIAADLLKSGLASGPLSQATFLEEIGEDPDVERERKANEASLPKSHTTPIFDAAHGDQKTRGRKPGTRDGEGE